MRVGGSSYFTISAADNVAGYWDDETYPDWAMLRLVAYMPRQRVGAGVEPHYHDCDETWLFVDGDGEAWLDGQGVTVTPNTLVHAPMGVVHRFQMFTDFSNVPVRTRLKGAARPIHLRVEEHGVPQPTGPGFVVPGGSNLGPIAESLPGRPFSELRVMTVDGPSTIADGPAPRTEYWVAIDDGLRLGVEGIVMDLDPGDLAIIRQGQVRSLSARTATRVAIVRS